MNVLDVLEEGFNTFKISGSAETNLFAHWNNVLSNMAPVLRHLTRSFRDANWYLHLLSVSRAIDLCFSFDCINCKRRLPIYYKDCLALTKYFPKIYESFINGDFVVRHSSRKGSAVPIDQALEKAYSKPAKSSAGIIGFTRRKKVVCKWNLIKHDKAKYRNFMNTVCQMDEDHEHSLDYEYSDRITKADKFGIAALVKNVLQRGNPFNLEQPKGIMNITTGAILEKDEEDFLMNCNSLGKAARYEFYESRPEKEKYTVVGNHSEN